MAIELAILDEVTKYVRQFHSDSGSKDIVKK